MDLTVKGIPFGKSRTSASSAAADNKIRECYAETLKAYLNLNDEMAHGGSVVFGGDFALSIPLDELCENAAMDNVINRSFAGIKATDAEALIKSSVLPLFPDDLLICIGEADIENGASAEVTAAAFAKLMACLKREAKGTRITVMSVNTHSNKDECNRYNELIGKITEQYGCEFADVSRAFEDENPEIKVFPMIGRFLRNGINFSQAMYLGAM